MTNDDWRLSGQQGHLEGRRMKWRKWSAPRPDWDHDNCAFCWAEFAAEASDHAPYDAGWITADDEDEWVCPPCFDGFRERLHWIAGKEPPGA